MLTPFLYLIGVVIGLTRVQHELPACMAWMGSAHSCRQAFYRSCFHIRLLNAA
jgi:hypothetical protein